MRVRLYPTLLFVSSTIDPGVTALGSLVGDGLNGSMLYYCKIFAWTFWLRSSTKRLRSWALTLKGDMCFRAVDVCNCFWASPSINSRVVFLFRCILAVTTPLPFEPKIELWPCEPMKDR